MGKGEKSVLCLIDSQNIYYTPKKIFGGQVDFRKLFHKIKAFSPLTIHSIVYLVADAVVEQVPFLRVLTDIGYQTRMKLMWFENDVSHNTNWDDEMIEEGLRLMPFYQGVILVSGDHGFIPFLNKWSAAGKSTQVICFERDVSAAIVRCHHPVDFLDQDVIHSIRNRPGYSVRAPPPPTYPAALIN
ncbi:MAG: NYN domain-containing protein [Desulfobacterales bacterium]|nr:NYN domain-containing protein [Desulfobacterales bacterium]